jgi:hypothetical protein
MRHRKKRGHVKTETEIGAMNAFNTQRNTKDCGKPTKAGRESGTGSQIPQKELVLLMP